MIETFSEEDKLLVRYLFNELEKEEARELEDEMLVDDELAKRAEVVEMNLIDCFARNELTDAECRRFKEGFLADPENRNKVDSALMFHESLRQLHEKDRFVSDRGWRRMPSAFFARPLPALALITLVVLVLTALVVFEIRRRAHKNSLTTNSAPPANVNQSVIAPPPSSVGANSKTASVKDPEVELARNDPDKFTQYEYIHSQDLNSTERGGARVHFVVRPQMKTLGLVYELADDKAAEKETFGIRIKNQYGERIWPQNKTREEVKPVFKKGGKRQKLIVVKVPLKVFKDGGPYLLEFDDQHLPAKQFTVKK